jgi:hypothetical protein
VEILKFINIELVSWMQEVTTGMRERGIGDLEWVDREWWRKKINLL